ncbi:MAG: right-handed parallel beta-helix repeat-containing protein, partial [Anaerolineaceae bacterium]|nr:right-handed parallel beta-helix repeat-containing protein [Anaerolineaceae bacterium]
RAKAEKRLGGEGKAALSGRRKILNAGAVFLVVALSICAIVFWPDQALDNTVQGTGLSSNTDQTADNNDQETAPQDYDVNANPETGAPIEGEIIIVSSAEEDGEGTLRQALLDAHRGDTITFEPSIFPPDNPATIYFSNYVLPNISQGDITIDASNAGVILDGSYLPQGGNNNNGLRISSDRNTVMGLQILNFQNQAIYLEGGSFNTIGGDRSIGNGPLGQGNLLGGFGYTGINVLPSCKGNTITGNYIGTDAAGNKTLGFMKAGIWFEGIDVHRNPNFIPNIVGPDNIIANNGYAENQENNMGGVVIESVQLAVTLTANSIYDNSGWGIGYFDTSDAAWELIPDPPTIIYFELETGIVSGQTCENCLVEIFSTDTEEGKIFEGSVTANQFGNFYFEKGGELSGSFLTATTRSVDEITSEFSLPTAERSDIQIALDEIHEVRPLYQIRFDSSDQVDTGNGGKVENGKLILTSSGGHVGASLGFYVSDSFAVEYEFRSLEFNAVRPGTCTFLTNNLHDNHISQRALFTDFNVVSGRTVLWYFVYPDSQAKFAESENSMDFSSSKLVTLIVIGDQIALFVDGQIISTALHPYGSVDYKFQGLSADTSATCEFDNYKLWDLSGVDFQP